MSNDFPLLLTHKIRYGKEIKNIGIGQIGSFRNESTTRTNLLRLKEFTQLELEVFSTDSTKERIMIDNVQYTISKVFKKSVDLTISFFKALDLNTTN